MMGNNSLLMENKQMTKHLKDWEYDQKKFGKNEGKEFGLEDGGESML